MTIQALISRSISASFFLIAVMLLRLLGKRLSRNGICLLWALAALRLLCPVTLESNLSLVPQMPQEVLSVTVQTPATVAPATAPVDTSSETPAEISAKPQRVDPLSLIWTAGVLGVLLWGSLGDLGLRRRLKEAAAAEPGVWEVDNLGSPFVLGLLRPRIYLPSDLTPEDRPWVLAHERAHIARRDPAWKLLGFVTLAVHWFNPLVWIGFFLFCRDLELACDQRVIRGLDFSRRKAYSTALVRCSAGNHVGKLCPLGFGEVGVKQRIREVLRYRKPVVWAAVLTLAVGSLAAVCLLTEPKTLEPRNPEMKMHGRTVWSVTNQALEVPAEALSQYCLVTNSTKIRVRISDGNASGTAQLYVEQVSYPDPGWVLVPQEGNPIRQLPSEKGEILEHAQEGTQMPILDFFQSGSW